jgi:hypothetical protein
MSPTQRTLAWFKERGIRAAVVERWNPHAKIRQDLFGWCDVLAVTGCTIGVQVTSAANASARIAKLCDEKADAVRACLNAGWRVFVHGWKRYAKRVNGKHWRCKVWEIRQRGTSNGRTLFATELEQEN